MQGTLKGKDYPPPGLILSLIGCIFFKDEGGAEDLINDTGKGTANNYQVLGNIYAIKKDIPIAIKAFKKSLMMEPNNSNTLYNLGISHQQMGQPQKGQDYLNKAFELDPSLKR